MGFSKNTYQKNSFLKIKKPPSGKPSWKELAMGADDWEEMGGKDKFI